MEILSKEVQLGDALRQVQVLLQPADPSDGAFGNLADAVRLIDAADTIINQLLHEALIVNRPDQQLQAAQKQLAVAREMLGSRLEAQTMERKAN